ncbi:MAG TPA: hypothetical protein DHW02_02875 [Ktedonobacter sp.]|nr:hypothetical protein [Ktedonobacter sp.]
MDMKGSKMHNIPQSTEIELVRIKQEYEQRKNNVVFADRYTLFNEAALLQTHGFERCLLSLLKEQHCTQLAEKRILDVGCGNGMQLQRFLAYGAQPSHLSGIDLLPERIEQAQQRYAGINWHVGSAHKLPYPDASFDLILLSVVFSSILDHTLRKRIADEIWRVRKPGGLILCYDFAYSNPRNAAVEGITRREVRRLFERPDAHFTFRRITLAPPLARRIAPHASWLADMLEHLKLLNTHLISLIRLDDEQE